MTTDSLRLDREAFDKIIKRSKKLREQLINRIKDYGIDSDLEKKFSAYSEVSQVARRTLDFGAAQKEEEVSKDKKIRPKPGLFRKYPWYRQYDETDCGAASLAMISRYFGKRLSISRLRDMANVGREGASLFCLAEAAETLGYKTRAVRTDYENLLNVDLPAIGHWAGYHYIVLYEVHRKYVLVGDPAIGLIKIPREKFEKDWTGRLLLLEPTSKLLEQEEKKTSVKRFLGLLTPYRGLLFEVFIASLIINLFGIASPIFTQTVIDKVLVHQDVKMLNLMLGGMLIVGVFSTLTTLLRYNLLIHISQKLSIRMTSELFQQIMRLPITYFNNRKVGDIITRFGDNAKVRDLITSDAINTLLDTIMVIVYLGVMFYYSPKLAMVAAIFIPFSIFITAIITPMIKRNNQKLFEKIAASESALIETIRNIDSLKASAAELPRRWRYEDLIVQNANQEWQSARLGMTLHGFTSAIQLLSSVVVLWYGALLVIDGSLTIGQLVAFNVLLGMVMAPVLGLIGMWQTMQDAFLSLQRLSDIYDSDPEEMTTSGAVVDLPPIKGEIKIENLSFRFSPDDKDVISNLNLEIQPGQTIAVVGRSGSGKTTLISLLQRFFIPSEGRILIDGTDTASVSVASLRSQMGIVLQDNALFTGTIRENISLGSPEASTDQIVLAAKLANAHDFITAFPLGYETMVGETGIQLSGGQRQRVAIARSLISEPRIIIFDEATSALDTESEKAIQDNMETILHDRTAIVIAHRLSTVRNADKIIVLDEGSILESGTHTELVEKRGLYYYLVSQQVGN
jgi:ATP-binding cassette, subfamily B, bacterial HlyB/CyaB